MRCPRESVITDLGFPFLFLSFFAFHALLHYFSCLKDYSNQYFCLSNILYLILVLENTGKCTLILSCQGPPRFPNRLLYNQQLLLVPTICFYPPYFAGVQESSLGHSSLLGEAFTWGGLGPGRETEAESGGFLRFYSCNHSVSNY